MWNTITSRLKKHEYEVVVIEKFKVDLEQKVCSKTYKTTTIAEFRNGKLYKVMAEVTKEVKKQLQQEYDEMKGELKWKKKY